jgi:hypothetical protein
MVYVRTVRLVNENTNRTRIIIGGIMMSTGTAYMKRTLHGIKRTNNMLTKKHTCGTKHMGKRTTVKIN